MKDDLPDRLGYCESCEKLQKLGWLEKGVVPPLPGHRPQHDDEEPLGVTFFRTSVREGDMENLTLSRTYFGRSEVGPVSFKNTDFSESTLCWNDFIEVDFTDADLFRSDLRSSVFTRVTFVRTNLQNADLRRSSFQDCDFTDANLDGAKLTCGQGKEISLSENQRRGIDWQSRKGEEPPGG